MLRRRGGLHDEPPRPLKRASRDRTSGSVESKIGTIRMPLINLSVKHGRTIEDARARLEQSVDDVSTKFGSFVQRVEWTSDRNGVKLFGTGFEIDMRVDTEAVHLIGDIPLIGKLLGSPIINSLRSVLENRFQKKLPDR